MSRWLIDSSAALKTLMVEAESDALATALNEFDGDLAGCWLLETEMRRATQRPGGPTQAEVSRFLERVSLFELSSSVFREAGFLPGANLRSLDAIHLAVAVRLGVDAVVTYDVRMQEACEALGLAVVAPA